jgi:hypothetical protein
LTPEIGYAISFFLQDDDMLQAGLNGCSCLSTQEPKNNKNKNKTGSGCWSFHP